MRSLLIVFLITLQINGQTVISDGLRRALGKKSQDWIAWNVSGSYPELKAEIFSLTHVRKRGLSAIYYQGNKSRLWKELKSSAKSWNEFLDQAEIAIQKNNAEDFAELFGKSKFGKGAILVDEKSSIRYALGEKKISLVMLVNDVLTFYTISNFGGIYKTECFFNGNQLKKIVSKRTHKKGSVLMPPG